MSRDRAIRVLDVDALSCAVSMQCRARAAQRDQLDAVAATRVSHVADASARDGRMPIACAGARRCIGKRRNSAHSYVQHRVMRGHALQQHREETGNIGRRYRHWQRTGAVEDVATVAYGAQPKVGDALIMENPVCC